MLSDNVIEKLKSQNATSDMETPISPKDIPTHDIAERHPLKYFYTTKRVRKIKMFVDCLSLVTERNCFA